MVSDTRAGDEGTVVGDDRPRERRRVLVRAATVLAGLLVFLALVTPNNVSRLPPGSSVPGSFVRIPLEALAGIALLLILPERGRRIVATVGGAALGVLTIVKVIDMGFFAFLSRPFNPVLDWILLDDGISFLNDSAGRAGVIATVVAAAVLVVALPVVMMLAVRRLAAVLDRHRAATTRSVTALVVAWAVLAVLGTQIVPGVPVAADSAATLAYEKVAQVPAGIRDRRDFRAEVAVDAFRDTPGEHLLTGLRGKDVILAFVESYGRSAVEDPQMGPQIDALLADGTRRLAAAGFAARSGFLTSPTVGSGSWLAHSTLLSGVWIDNEQRYRNLVSGDRMSLIRAFQRADWRTVGVEPGVVFAWPEGDYYGYDQIYDSRELGYNGPAFSWATMPDQYVLQAFERLERAKKDRGPLMAEITLVSSHAPWAPIPEMVDWPAVGDGSVYGPIERAGAKPGEVWKDDARVRTEYRRSVEYSLTSLVSYVEEYGDDDLVLVFLGDHQPVPIVTGADAGRDVPVTIVAHDPAVLKRIEGWGWSDGLRPAPDAPVWRMSAFRDRFLTAFGPQPAPTR